MLKCDTIIHLVLNLYGAICKWKLISRYLQFLCNVYFIIYFCVCEVIRMKVYTKTHSCIKRFLVWPLFSFIRLQSRSLNSGLSDISGMTSFNWIHKLCSDSKINAFGSLILHFQSHSAFVMKWNWNDWQIYQT